LFAVIDYLNYSANCGFRAVVFFDELPIDAGSRTICLKKAALDGEELGELGEVDGCSENVP